VPSVGSMVPPQLAEPRQPASPAADAAVGIIAAIVLAAVTRIYPRMQTTGPPIPCSTYSS